MITKIIKVNYSHDEGMEEKCYYSQLESQGGKLQNEDFVLLIRLPKEGEMMFNIYSLLLESL